MRVKMIALGLLVGFATSATAMADARIPSVNIEHKSSDEGGRALEFRIEEEFRKSASLRLAEDAAAQYTIILTTVGTDYSLDSVTVYSAIVVYTPTPGEVTFVTSVTGYCPKGEAASCASSIYERLGPKIIQFPNELILRSILRSAAQRK